MGFISVLDFYEYLSTRNTAETCKTELWPFLTIFGTGMRAKYFEQKASAGTALAFTSDLPQRLLSNTNVYVMGVDFSAENLGTQNIRNYTLHLQEA